MKPYFLTIIFCLFAAPSVQAQLVDASMSGSWYDPSHDGEGFVVQILQDQQAVLYWFTYDESGAQRWFIATGTVEDDRVNFSTLLQPTGAAFGEGFNPDSIEYAPVGELSIHWNDCSTATATYTVDGAEGSQALTRLTTLAGLECGGPPSPASMLSGSWFDQTHEGEGLVIEALADGRAVTYWFSYNGSGGQAWFIGTGDTDGSTISITDTAITRGGRFGADFNPEDVRQTSWGSLDIQLGCDYGKLDYDSRLPVYGSGKQTLARLTRVGDPACEEVAPPNILLVIADDLGKDASNQYAISAQLPATPTLDQLANEGLVFDNAWSNPTCSATRAGVLTGKYGSRTGVLQPGDLLSEEETSLPSFIHQHLPGRYVDAVIGKWHLGGQGSNPDHPNNLGVGHFAGITGGAVTNYQSWTLTTNGERSSESAYVTSKLVDLAIEWTGAQDKPWFLWLAFNAPHDPFHLPPEPLHGRDLPGTDAHIDTEPLPYYLAAIEALDTELGRFLASMDPETRDNTVIVFMGDNGSPAVVAQSPYGRGEAKGSLYQGGVNVPFFVSGAGVARAGERESALVNTTDLFSTIAALAGVNVEAVHDSQSFADLLNDAQPAGRYYQFTEKSGEVTGEWAVSDGVYKLIHNSAGNRQLYQLPDDPYEDVDLLESGGAPEGVVEDLQFLAELIRQGPSPDLPEQPFNYANIPLPTHLTANQFPGQFQFQRPATDSDNTPENNPITDAGATLGRVLFFDERLSANGTVSCASCHQQEQGFSDPRVLSAGFDGGFTRRHSMGLANARFYFTGRFFWDERAATLESQVLMPFQDPVEMGLTLDGLVQIVNEQSYYPSLFENAFGDEEVTTERISLALAQFVRSLVSTTAPYDQARSEVDSPLDDFPSFTAQENRGKDLFFRPVQVGNGDSASCAVCHASEAFVAAIPRGPVVRTIATVNGLDAESTDDLGIAETTGNANDEGKFKVTSLKNIAIRPPYMHDGRFATLEEVIDHYSDGIQSHPNLTPPLRGPNGEAVQFGFTGDEKAALIAFLETLTDHEMMTDEKFSNPFE